MESRVIKRYVVPDLAALSREAAKEVCMLLSDAIAKRGDASLVLCGGKTPRNLYILLGTEFRRDVAWNHVDFFWGDERYVTHDHQDSNYRLANETLLVPLGISADRIHSIPTTFDNPTDAALSYEKHLRDHFKSPIPSFDVLLLGMGADGHVASLFPGSPALLDDKSLVTVTRAPVPPIIRLTLTLQVINNAASVLILVAGKGKREILTWIQHSKHRKTYPISSVTGRNRLLWFVDRAAAGINP